jgi:hypothetical protein
MSATTLRISIPLSTKAAWAPKHLLMMTPAATVRRHKPPRRRIRTTNHQHKEPANADR